MAKTLLVVGASSDMGTRLIECAAEDYGRIYAHYRMLNGKLEHLKSVLGDKLVLVQADLTQEEEIGALIDQINTFHCPPSQIVQFAAPSCTNGHFHKLAISAFDEALIIGLRSTILICQAFLPAMVKQRYGRIVMMLSSVLSGPPAPYCAHYMTEKYALLGLMRSLASEYAAKGITVNGVSPSWTDTKYIQNQPEILVKKYAAENPAGRLLHVDEIIPAIRFLLSDGSGQVNGQNIFITGGR
ncbi:SDR family NAD(P)-dependent oxidoreductase [Gehongia tenuis]|uniref:SDR family oxidoreductase n=1 Tax=Gehongia tenuis TaxID=2763655 RepID=A0A926D1L7_9FIRM|nr:SDR family oxidoreductase [Gehongia tenuis]MBC8530725.1 SDR family oxidoreductase [Gehongia tenuis]